MSHGAPFAPTYPNPAGEEQIRTWIAEARAYNNNGYWPDEATAPLPEFYYGQYEDHFGIERKP